MTTRTELGRAASSALLALGLLLGFACDDTERAGPQAGSETHFLTRCSAACSGGFECVCGVCTVACADTSVCSALVPVAECRAPHDCTVPPDPTATCDVTCTTDTDCGAVGPRHTCDDGFCRAPSTSGESGSGGAPSTCPTEPVPANQIVVLGDSLIELSGMTAYLEELARSNGSLEAGASYRDHASALTSFLTENGFNIAMQYDAAVAQGAIKAVIMDGGATDVLQTGCSEPPTADCTLVVQAVAGVRALLARMANDGVEKLVYFFYADAVNNPALLARIDVLRPLIRAECENGPLECRFLDLREPFADHLPEYISATDSSGIVFSAEGAQAAARLIFDEMRAACIVD
jgi:hypothetical protein